ncbi:MAG: bifunctional adenosylcobinamide kinase/adenosylcobinamide-phosphate guanylyltransferase [Thermodesulfovibrionales bacterium]|nr:bifunctional adenosylcobinamide kinase/adenosylcobinamide-phosphate guanylyltransferase [Thermodesulfovibrionales bacterium]
MITFIIGGANSGKSSFALNLSEKIQGKGAFIATAQAFDDEMTEKIKIHKQQRGHNWDTYEEPFEIADLIINLEDRYDKFILDCLTLWLSNLIGSSRPIESSIDYLINKLETLKKPIFIVSNEVGLGIVPENKLARSFRNYAGILNKKIASISENVYIIFAGLSLKIK